MWGIALILGGTALYAIGHATAARTPLHKIIKRTANPTMKVVGHSVNPTPPSKAGYQGGFVMSGVPTVPSGQNYFQSPSSLRLKARGIRANIIKSGSAAAVFLLGVYFTTVSFISGWDFALSQFRQYWYFIVSLAVGFGVQIGLYVYLKHLLKSHAMRGAGKVVATTGTTSTVAMISCCAHYLASALPIIGISGFLTAIGQYQKELFWVGLASNIVGISFLWRNIKTVRHHL